jgi:acetylornithine deacetylase/succinyl-diaminopimelate desuccinylase-like protein
LTEERFNVMATYKGTGNGYSLLFNGHMDQVFYEETDKELVIDAKKPAYGNAWVEDDKIYGYGVTNCKGPIVAFMMAGRAIKEAGVKLKGDLILAPSVGECEGEPIEEWKAPKFTSHDAGARYLIAHGGVADYALVAEATAYTIVTAEPGTAWFKIIIYAGPFVYTPFLKRPYSLDKTPNALVKAAAVIQKLEDWAYEYAKKNTYPLKEGGSIIPNATVGGVRGGSPWRPIGAPEYCNIYFAAYIPPNKKATDLQEELRKLIVEEMGIKADIELYAYHRGYEAQGADKLMEAIKRSHKRLFNNDPGTPHPAFTSMWRDVNLFNEADIPSVSYGFATSYTSGDYFGGNYYTTKNEMVLAAKAYALIAMDLCSKEKG